MKMRDQPGEEHFRKLERTYLSAPTNDYYRPSIEVAAGKATITIPVRDVFLHAARSVHGSVYFKALDDAAFFAAQSTIAEAFLLTASFGVDFFRPVSGGILRAEGRLVHTSRRRLLADSQLFDDEDRLVARGRGSFMPSAVELGPDVGYR